MSANTVPSVCPFQLETWSLKLCSLVIGQTCALNMWWPWLQIIWDRSGNFILFMEQFEAGKTCVSTQLCAMVTTFCHRYWFTTGLSLSDPPESTGQIPGPSQDSNHSPVILAVVSVTNGPEIKNLMKQMAGKLLLKLSIYGKRRKEAFPALCL